MRHQFKLMMITLLCLKQAGRAFTVRKFVYQKDMSEYCRRRVMPSVFLGRHVAEAHSQILHFTKLELPYSCFISVRGESGTNLILVVQLISDDSLTEACDANPNQLLVYEMGETFGGYWGPLTESLMWPSHRPPAPAPSMYTLRATEPYEELKEIREPVVDVETASQTTKTEHNPTKPQQEYITIEVPLVNLSSEWQLGAPEAELAARTYNMDEAFDMFYDVTPRSQEKYETSLLPMVQFSIGQKMSGRRFGSEPGYDLEYDIRMLTPDERLSYPHFTSKPSTGRHKSQRVSHENIRTYKKHNSLYTVTKRTVAQNSQQTANTLIDTSIKSWKEIEYILKELNQSTLEENKNAAYAAESLNITRILESMDKDNRNYSAYLNHNLETLKTKSLFNMKTPTKLNFGSFTKKLMPHITYATRNIHKYLKSTTYFNFTNNYIATLSVITDKITEDGNISQAGATTQVSTASDTETVETNMPFAINTSSLDGTTNITLDNDNQKAVAVSEQILSTKTYNLTVPTETIQVQTTTKIPSHDAIVYSRTPVAGPMVDHESWENVVLAAPGMAVLLNQTSTNRKSVREKRKIQPILIEQARPHHLTTQENQRTTHKRGLGIADMQDFAQLIELQDDELHDRVALRYLRQYVGSTLYNICEFSEPKTRHVYLFNSSRIVLAISNFTLERMTVVLTPSRTLDSGVAKCSATSLECQVYGTRVCIDQINACDGVPNCGAYDIYDEDRLMCGAAVGLQHNVYLAAFTFLAVLLTMLYTVHYWLKRCVPKVSEAFFVYTDRAENILFLESIMRSPYDTQDSTTNIHENFYGNIDINYPDETKIMHENIFLKAWRSSLAFVTCRYKKIKNNKSASLGLEIGEHLFKEQSRMFSVTELELKKIGLKAAVDVSVQTGDSLEMPQTSNEKSIPKAADRSLATHDMLASFDSRNLSSELNILKFFKQTRSDSLPSTSFDTEHISVDSIELANVEEKEIKSHSYHQPVVARGSCVTKSPKQKTVLEVLSEKPSTSRQASKHLRFEQGITTIPSSDWAEEDTDFPRSSDDTKDTIQKRRHGTKRTEGEQTFAGPSLDLKRFWTNKGKKGKKKAHLTLH